MSKTAHKKQCAVLAYRQGKQGLQIALVTSLETRRWVPPKGNLVTGLSERRSAALEACEEAGLEGSVAKRSIGTYDYRKTELKGGELCRVSVFPMAVTRAKRNWPEKALRRRKWMSVDAAIAAVSETGLKKLISDLADEVG